MDVLRASIFDAYSDSPCSIKHRVEREAQPSRRRASLAAKLAVPGRGRTCGDRGLKHCKEEVFALENGVVALETGRKQACGYIRRRACLHGEWRVCGMASETERAHTCGDQEGAGALENAFLRSKQLFCCIIRRACLRQA